MTKFEFLLKTIFESLSLVSFLMGMMVLAFGKKFEVVIMLLLAIYFRIRANEIKEKE